MTTCAFTTINGLNKDCEAFLSAVKGVAVHAPDYSFANKAAASNLATWKLAIDTNLKMEVYRALRNTEITDIEAVQETDGFGAKLTTAFNAPSMVLHMSSNPCDFGDLVSKGSRIVRVIPVLENGSKMATVSNTGVIKGFEAQLIAIPINPKGRENQIAQYKVQINFTNVDEFKQAVTWNDGITLLQYVEYMPVGYTQEITSALSNASMSVKITKRCASNVLGTDTFVAEITDSNCSAPAITVGALSSGVSVLTVYASGTTPLVAGQYIKFRLCKMSTAVYSQITNELVATL